jgi:hypothetical protein
LNEHDGGALGQGDTLLRLEGLVELRVKSVGVTPESG